MKNEEGALRILSGELCHKDKKWRRTQLISLQGTGIPAHE